ncbi:unnamed protein product [Ilex paraguariensis]|uniref:Uncharacterized protein n=1 Tax=Ilex paraguariensis TaxID=185542 RepID=A0ABC8UK37_9AQUA
MLEYCSRFILVEVLCYLAPLCTKNISLFWQGSVLFGTALYKEYQLVLARLHGLHRTDADWVISSTNAFAKQYELYTSDDEHAVLLHRLQQIPQLHYPIEAIQSIPFSDSKFQILEAQKAELRCLLPRTCRRSTPQTKSNNKCTDRRVFPEDFLTALRTIGMQEDELCQVSSLLKENASRRVEKRSDANDPTSAMMPRTSWEWGYRFQNLQAQVRPSKMTTNKKKSHKLTTKKKNKIKKVNTMKKKKKSKKTTNKKKIAKKNKKKMNNNTAKKKKKS